MKWNNYTIEVAAYISEGEHSGWVGDKGGNQYLEKMKPKEIILTMDYYNSFKWLILQYLNTFNQIPPNGLILNNEEYDPLLIKEVEFKEKSILFILDDFV